MPETDGKPAGGGKTLSVADSPAERSPAAEPLAAGRQAPRSPDRRNQRRWVPVAAAWLCLLIGLADIIEVVHPGLFYTSQMTRFHALVPGTLVNVTHTVSVIIGLLLLMLARPGAAERRAWEAAIQRWRAAS
jgi:hypothetical protein